MKDIANNTNKKKYKRIQSQSMRRRFGLAAIPRASSQPELPKP